MRKYWKLILLATFLFVIILLNYSGLFSVLNIDLINQHHDYIVSYIEANFYFASLLFILIYIIAVIFSIPGAWLLTVSGGYLFGWQIGGFLAIISATIGACIIFLMAKNLLRDFFRNKIIAKKSIFQKIEDGVNNNALSYLLFMRLMPIFPFVFVNIAPAILGIRFKIYAFTTFIGIIPGTIVYALLGEGASEVFISGDILSYKGYDSIKIIIGLSGLSILSLSPLILKYIKFYKNK
jgi:uncharacterized membrane protein YdjX (TVP38/TMEM64 family)